MGTGRGQFERVFGPRAWRRPQPSGLEIVGTSRATTPASLTSDAGANIVIPLPPGVAEFDRMLAGLYCGVFSSTWNLYPPEWTPLVVVGGVGKGITLAIFEREAGASEPASYTWQNSAGTARGGEMIVIRNASSVGPYAAASPTFTVPDLAATAGSMLVAFCACIAPVIENWTAVSPLVLERQHVTYHAGIPYGNNAGSAMASEQNLSAMTISGRTFTKPSGGSASAGGVIVKP